MRTLKKNSRVDSRCGAGPVVALTSALLMGGCGSSDTDPRTDALVGSTVEAGAPACGQQQWSSAGSKIGFQPPVPILPDAEVTEVAADHLRLKSNAFPAMTFAWSGPTLVGEFSVGEKVSCESDGTWQIVRGTRRTAAVYYRGGSGFEHTGQIPNGPSYSLQPQCVLVDRALCPTDPPTYTFYEVLATLDGSSVQIPMQTTAALSDWQITNVFHQEGGGATSCGCCFDYYNVGALSALGPR